MKKFSKALLCSLTLSLALAPTMASAKSTSMSPAIEVGQKSGIYTDEFTFTHEGIEYNVMTEESEDFMIATYNTDKGMEKHVIDRQTGEVSVTSDYLSAKETQAVEESIKSVTVEMEDESLSLFPNKAQIEILEASSGDDNQIQEKTGSWVWSHWNNVTVTFAGKTTASAIASAILSRIPLIGWVAGAMATVIIANKYETGYFKVRGASALDTDPNYGWMKKQTNLYTNKDRIVLKKSETSDPVRVRMY